MKVARKRMARSFALMLLAGALLIAGGCSGAPQEDGPLVLAAASLQDALSDAADLWEERGNSRPVLSFAGTPSLARQARANAPADIIITADDPWMDALDAAGTIRPESRTILASNRLVLIAPVGTNINLALSPGFDWARALGGSRLAMADPQAVPAGRYARQALAHLGAWAMIKDRIVPTQNVRIALALVAQREVRLGIVYATDANAEPDVEVVGTFPATSHPSITYPAAILARSRHADSQRFLAFLQSAEAQILFRNAGFAALAAGNPPPD